MCIYTLNQIKNPKLFSVRDQLNSQFKYIPVYKTFTVLILFKFEKM